MNEMSMKTKVAFACYLALLLMMALPALSFLTASEPRSYHLQAMGVRWEDVPSGVQFMFLSALRGVGSFLLVTVLSVGVILFIPFRRGERWARWATPVLCIAGVSPLVAGVFSVAANTGASTPRLRVVIVLLLAVLGLFLSGDVGKPKRSVSEAAEG